MAKNNKNTYQNKIKAQLFLLVFWGLFLGVSIALYNLSAISLLLSKGSVSQLPQIFIFSGLLGVLVLSLYAYQKNRFAFSTIAYFSFIVIIFSIFYTYYHYHIAHIDTVEESRFAYVLMILMGPINALIFNNFRNFQHLVFQNNPNRKLSEWSHIGIIIGAVTVFFTSPYIQSFFGISLSEFIPFSGVILVFATLFLWWANSKIAILRELTSSAQYINVNNGYHKLAKNNYLVLLSLFLISSVVMVVLVEYYFYSIIDTTPTKIIASIDQYIGYFYGITLLSGVAIYAFAYNPVINKLGLKIGMLILPIVMGVMCIISVAIGAYFSIDPNDLTFGDFLTTIAIAHLLGLAISDNFTSHAFKFFFLPIEGILRQDIQLKVTEVLKQVAIIIAGGLLLLLTHIKVIQTLVFESIVHVGLVFIFTLVCSIVVFKIYSRYREVLKSTLDKQQLVKADEGILSYAQKLAKATISTPIHALPRHLNLIKTLDPVVYTEAVLSIIHSENEHVQKIALYEAKNICLLEAIPILDEIKQSKYFNVSRNRDLLENVYQHLKGSEFRLAKLTYIEQLTYSKLVSERVFGASLTRYAAIDMKPTLLNKLFRDPVHNVRYHAAAAAGNSDDEFMIKSLIGLLDSAHFSNAAVASIATNNDDSILHVLETAFHQTSQTEKIQLRIVQIYGRIGTQEAVGLLLKKLELPNPNISSGALNALSKSGYNVKRDKAISIKRELEDTCSTIIWNMSAYIDLEKFETSDLLMAALQSEINDSYAIIFQLLSLLYDPKSVDLVRENINSPNADQSDFAAELLDIFMEDALKPYVLPILNNSTYVEKIKMLQYILPSNTLKKREILYNLIQKDYKNINRWTKACALLELSTNNSTVDLEIFAANLVNPDQLLREIATMAYNNLSNEKFDDFMNRNRYKKAYVKQAQVLIEEINNKKNTEQIESPNLNIEIVQFLNSIDNFNLIPGLVLSKIAKFTKPAYYQAGTLISEFQLSENMPYAFVYRGNLQLTNENGDIKTYEQNSFVHGFDLINMEMTTYKLIATEDTMLFIIDRHEFSELCSFHEILPKTLLKQHSVRREKEPLVSA